MSFSVGSDRYAVNSYSRTVVPVWRALLPLPLGEYVFLYVMAIVPASVIYLYADYPMFNEVVLAVMLGIYVVLRVILSHNRYKKTPTMEINRERLILPHSHTPSGQALDIRADEVEKIDFNRGVLRMSDIDVSMVITTKKGKRLKIGALALDLEKVRGALDKFNWKYERHKNGKQHFATAAAVVVSVLFGAYIAFMPF